MTKRQMTPFEAWVDRWSIGPGMNDRGDRYSGFDGSVGLGWIPILDDLAADLYALGWTGKVAQIKEKFGTLRFYLDGGTEALYERVSQAEQLSAVTCEVCGAPGELRGGGWLKTLCDSCAQGRPACGSIVT